MRIFVTSWVLLWKLTSLKTIICDEFFWSIEVVSCCAKFSQFDENRPLTNQTSRLWLLTINWEHSLASIRASRYHENWIWTIIFEFFLYIVNLTNMCLCFSMPNCMGNLLILRISNLVLCQRSCSRQAIFSYLSWSILAIIVSEFMYRKSKSAYRLCCLWEIYECSKAYMQIENGVRVQLSIAHRLSFSRSIVNRLSDSQSRVFSCNWSIECIIITYLLFATKSVNWTCLNFFSRLCCHCCVWRWYENVIRIMEIVMMTAQVIMVSTGAVHQEEITPNVTIHGTMIMRWIRITWVVVVIIVMMISMPSVADFKLCFLRICNLNNSQHKFKLSDWKRISTYYLNILKIIFIWLKTFFLNIKASHIPSEI